MFSDILEWKPMKKFLGALIAVCVLALSPAQAEIVIATVGPMTGSTAWLGEQMRRGAEQAVKDLNAAGGVLGQQVSLKIEDDKCNATEAVRIAQRLAGQGIALVAGHACSASSIQASKVYADRGVLMISPASSRPDLTEKGLSNVFRVVPRDDYRNLAAGRFLADKLPEKKIAFLHDGTPYSKSLIDTALSTYRDAGGNLALVDTYGQGKHSQTDLLSRMKDAGVEAFYLPRHPDKGVSMIHHARDMGYKPEFYCGAAPATGTFWNMADPAADGVLTTFSPNLGQNPSAADVVSKFERQGFEPDGYTLYTYGAIQAWAAAASKAGSINIQEVANILRSEQFDTVLGLTGFDPKGDIKMPIKAWKVMARGDFRPDNHEPFYHCCNANSDWCCPPPN